MIDLDALRRMAEGQNESEIVSRAWMAQAADEIEQGRKAMARLRVMEAQQRADQSIVEVIGQIQNGQIFKGAPPHERR